MNLRLLLVSTAVAAAFYAVEAKADAITVGSGWQYDQADALNSPSEGSPWTFTVPTGDSYTFSLTDGYIAGDIYSVTINGLVTATSTFTQYATTFVNDLGPAAYFASNWTDSAFSHLQLTFSAGTYSLVIKDIQDEGLPAGFGVRLDSAVPEASTWAMLLAGFAGLGFAGYRARRAPMALG
jgi:hypothetical protein